MRRIGFPVLFSSRSTASAAWDREDAADGCREVESSEVYESHQLGNVLRLRSVVPQDLVLVQDQGDAVGHGEGLAADADEYESAVGRQ